MKAARKFAAWFFSPPTSPICWWRVIWWWELRRVPFNFLIGIYGMVCFLIFLWGILTGGRLEPGEDAVEPVALLFATLALNFFYSLGWVVEVIARWAKPTLSPLAGPRLLKLGAIFSLAILSVPALYWGVVGCLHWAR